MQAVGGISAGRISVNLYVLGKGEIRGYRGPTAEEIEKMCARKFVHRIEGSDRDATLHVTADLNCPATKLFVTFNGKGWDSKTFEGVVVESNATKTICARFGLAELVAAGCTSAEITLSKNKTAC